MKILHFITSLRTGGAERLVCDLTPRLRDMGNEVEVLLMDGTRTPLFSELEGQGIRISALSEGDEKPHGAAKTHRIPWQEPF